jgi:pectate lyase
VTFHHNWWSTLCVERMPRVRFGRVHVFNNYFNSPGNNYCVRASLESEVLVEHNFFQNIDEPYEKFNPPGLIRASNNLTVNCTGVQNFNDSVFTPPYTYTPDAAASVPGAVTNWAGAGKIGL